MRLLLRVFFGLDASFGILWYASVSLYFGENFNPLALIFSIFCAISPDVDFLPWKILRKKFNIQSHQDIFHLPIPFIPSIVGIGIIIAQFLEIKELFISTIIVGTLIFHFYHDGLSEVGMHWGAPFFWHRVIMHKGFIPRIIDKKLVDDFYDKLNETEKGTKNFVEALTKRSAKSESVNVWKITFWIFSIGSLFLYYAQS